jgi:SSS family solute:Na+ symporter
MGVIITFGVLAAFFAAVILVLQRSYVADRNFSDFTVAGRSFGGFYQAMAFLNTYLPGTVFISSVGFVVGAGAIGIGILSIMLSPLVMYLMADRVWIWGAAYDLKTQPDLMALRFGSRAIRVIAALIGVAGLFPWMVLGMQSLGAVFHALSLGHLDFTTSVVLGVVVMTVRQVWTIRMGMRGIVISDLFQGIVAYGIGSLLVAIVIAWLYAGGASLAAVPPERLALPGPGTPMPLLFFSLTLLPLLCSLCWPDLFVRLYTGSGIRAVKRSSAYCAPIALVFMSGLYFMALLASGRADVAAAPDNTWFTLAFAAGGPWLLALAGTAVFAASMGNIDATVQSSGAQIANDVLAVLRGGDRPMSERALIVSSQITMAAITFGAAFIACLPLPSLFTVALFAFQLMVQISVPLYFGIFTKFGNREGAIASMLSGIVVASALQVLWPVGVPWAYGLTAGTVALFLNVAVYVAAGLLLPKTERERARLDALFATAANAGEAIRHGKAADRPSPSIAT